MWRNITYRRINDVDRLRYLLWKNYLLTIRTKSKVFSLIGIPILFTLIFFVIRLLRPDVEMEHKIFPKLHLFHGLKVDK